MRSSYRFAFDIFAATSARSKVNPIARLATFKIQILCLTRMNLHVLEGLMSGQTA